jgi:hypothetical protein
MGTADSKRTPARPSSQVTGRGGTLLDGTPLHDIIQHIDGTVTPPCHYLFVCVHRTARRAGIRCA